VEDVVGTTQQIESLWPEQAVGVGENAEDHDASSHSRDEQEFPGPGKRHLRHLK